MAPHKARKSSISVSQRVQDFHRTVLRDFRTDRQVEAVLMPAVALMGLLSELAEEGSPHIREKAGKSLRGLVNVGNLVLKKLKIPESE